MSNYISGNIARIEKLSNTWTQIELPTRTFYIDDLFKTYIDALAHVRGAYTDIESDRKAVVRFEQEEDAVIFKLHFKNG